MAREIIKNEDGTTTIISITGDGFLERSRESMNNLVKKLLFDVQEFKVVTVKVRKTNQDYDYDVQYGEIPTSFDNVVELQNTVRIFFDDVREKDPSKQEVTGEGYRWVRRFDPLGFRRLTKYFLENKKNG